MANINRVVLVGNLTRDPELRHTPSGTAVCSLRIGGHRQVSSTGEHPVFLVRRGGGQGKGSAWQSRPRVGHSPRALLRGPRPDVGTRAETDR